VQPARGYLVAVNASRGCGMNAQLHVLFGAGQVGRPLAQLPLDADKRVRVAKRSPGGVPPDIEVIHGDAVDPGFCAKPAEGAATVYHCINPPYDARIWAQASDHRSAARALLAALLCALLRNTLDYLPRKTADDCLIDCRNLACRAFRNKRQPRPHVGWVDAQPAAIQLDFSPICFGAASAARYPLPCQNRWG
jgi:hypothetical protein